MYLILMSNSIWLYLAVIFGPPRFYRRLMCVHTTVFIPISGSADRLYTYTQHTHTGYLKYIQTHSHAINTHSNTAPQTQYCITFKNNKCVIFSKPSSGP